jgi:hypothetical protein
MTKKVDVRKFAVGDQVTHPIYGIGVVQAVFSKRTDYERQVDRLMGSRYKGNLNLDVLFYAGGPRGWALNSDHDVRELVRKSRS